MVGTARPLLGERINDRFPRLTTLAQAGAFDVQESTLPYTLQRALDRFTFGLELVLDSIGTRIAAAQQRSEGTRDLNRSAPT